MNTDLFFLENLKVNEFYPFFAKSFSLHEMLEQTIAITGPVEAWITTYTLSEDAIRSLFNLSEQNKLTFTLVTDRSFFRHKMQLMLFAQNCRGAKIYTTANHSKVMVLTNDNWKITILTSANLTKNERWESGILSTHPVVADDYLSAINKLISDATPVDFNN